MNPNSEDNLKKRNVLSPSSETSIGGFDELKSQTQNFYKRKKFDDEEIIQWDQEKTMALNQKARWFAILFSVCIGVVLISFIIEDISHLKDTPKFKSQQIIRFLFIAALSLLVLIQIVYTCLYQMWPVNMVVERILLMYSSSIAGAIFYSMFYQLYLSSQS